MFDPTEFSQLQWLFSPVLIFGRYFITCLVLFVVFYFWKKRELIYLKIQQKFPQNSDYQREIVYSAITSVIFGAMAYFCLGTEIRHYTRFYTDIHQYGIGFVFFAIPLTLLIHDTWFYWIHRLMHHPRIYRKVHLVHHKSINPSPWASYSFHPIEAVLEAGIIPFLLFTVPLHPVSFFGFITLMLWFNIYGHLGYELYPRWVYEHPLGRWLNSAMYHNEHHERFEGNYGLYFTFWDRLMGTLRSDSPQRLDKLYQRIEEEKIEKIKENVHA